MPTNLDHAKPDACEAAAELRADIDALDGPLDALLDRRARFIDRAVLLEGAKACRRARPTASRP